MSHKNTCLSKQQHLSQQKSAQITSQVIKPQSQVQPQLQLLQSQVKHLTWEVNDLNINPLTPPNTPVSQNNLYQDTSHQINSQSLLTPSMRKSQEIQYQQKNLKHVEAVLKMNLESQMLVRQQLQLLMQEEQNLLEQKRKIEQEVLNQQKQQSKYTEKHHLQNNSEIKIEIPKNINIAPLKESKEPQHASTKAVSQNHHHHHHHHNHHHNEHSHGPKPHQLYMILAGGNNEYCLQVSESASHLHQIVLSKWRNHPNQYFKFESHHGKYKIKPSSGEGHLHISHHLETDGAFITSAHSQNKSDQEEFWELKGVGQALWVLLSFCGKAIDIKYEEYHQGQAIIQSHYKNGSLCQVWNIVAVEKNNQSD